MTGVHLITAVGLSGQLGLDGKVPWHGDPKYAEHTKRDLAEFARATAGCLLIMGSVTADSLPVAMLRSGQFVGGNRMLEIWHESYGDPADWLTKLRLIHARDIWICGGQKVYELFIPFVDWHHISVIPYDGPADRWMPPIIPGWGRSKEAALKMIEDIEMDYGDGRTRY